jgi:hypothetical protein
MKNKDQTIFNTTETIKIDKYDIDGSFIETVYIEDVDKINREEGI